VQAKLKSKCLGGVLKFTSAPGRTQGARRDGYDVTRQLKAKALPRPPLVVLLSIHSDELSKQRGVQAGCDAFVEKGLGWRGLLPVLQKVLAAKDSDFHQTA
jgi:CheY-like chemotaxis protein